MACQHLFKQQVRFIQKRKHIMNIIKEKPFEYLKRMENGEKFEEETVRNWYIARAFVLDKLKNIAFKPDSNTHLHVVIADDTPLMLSVVRQVALSAHYFNFNEESEDDNCYNRTVITLVSKNPYIRKELEKEEYLCNLPKYCKFKDKGSAPENIGSYIDIEIHIVDYHPLNEGEENTLYFRKEDVDAWISKQDEDSIFSIDTRMAIYAQRIYSLGAVIDNLPAEDINCTKRYALALDVFQHEKLRKNLQPMIDEDSWKNLATVKENISNIFCSDCFLSRKLSIQLCIPGDVLEDEDSWEKHNKALSVSEHARWVVEKLIMGYSPFNPLQRFKDESLFYDKKKKEQYRKSLKKQEKYPAHINLCSHADLRRINPENMKYDSFLMLTIPKILKRVGE